MRRDEVKSNKVSEVYYCVAPALATENSRPHAGEHLVNMQVAGVGLCSLHLKTPIQANERRYLRIGYHGPFDIQSVEEAGDELRITEETLAALGFQRNGKRLELMFDDEDGIFAEPKGPAGYYFTSFYRHVTGDDSAEIYPDPETIDELNCIIGILKRKAASYRAK